MDCLIAFSDGSFLGLAILLPPYVFDYNSNNVMLQEQRLRLRLVADASFAV